LPFFGIDETTSRSAEFSHQPTHKGEPQMATPDTEILRASIPAAQLAELEAITGQKASKWLRANMGEIIALARGERLQL